MSLCTTAVLETPTLQTNLFGVIRLESQYLPYALLALTFVQAGPQETVCQGTGLVNAYIYRHLRETMPAAGGVSYLRTPNFITRLVGQGGFLTPTATAKTGGTSRPYGSVFRPANEIPPSSSASSGSGNGSYTATTRSNVVGLGARSSTSQSSNASTQQPRARFSGPGQVLGGES